MADAKKVIWAIKSQLGVHEALGTSHSYNAIVLGDALSVIEELQAEIERLKNAMVETGAIHCPCSPDCGDDCEKCVDSAIEETLKEQEVELVR